jgi:hypothetical protein
MVHTRPPLKHLSHRENQGLFPGVNKSVSSVCIQGTTAYFTLDVCYESRASNLSLKSSKQMKISARDI